MLGSKFALMLSCQLSAGGGDIVSAFDSLGGVDPFADEDAAKSTNPLLGGSGKALFGIDPVEWNQVDDAWHTFY